MAELEITQVRSASGKQVGQQRTLRALGLRRVRHTVRQPDRPEIRGMVAKVAHLVEVRYPGGAEELDLEPGQEPKGEGNPPAGSSIGDEESAELAEATEEAVAVGSSVDDAADVIENPPSLQTTDDPTKPKPRGGGSPDDSDAEDAGAASEAAPAEDEES